MNSEQSPPPARIKGRGAASNPEGRFESTHMRAEDDGWYREEESGPPRPPTQVTEETARSIIARNDSPDVKFELSINPYRGCEHGCAYCYARPSHAYLNLSSGLDFETKLFAKTNAVNVLREELGKKSYRCSPINLGANTDPYQPIERRYRITRQVIELLAELRHPITIVTKSAGIERDIDLLAPMAQHKLVHAFISVSMLDNELASRLEPRASAPHRRLKAIKTLSDAGIPTGVLVSPIIPMINDRDLEGVLERARDHGAIRAGYTLIRLAHDLKQLFRQWLDIHYPQRAEHVMSLIRQMRGGRDNDPRFGHRMRGTGVFAELIRRRFRVATERLGYTRAPLDLDIGQFAPPARTRPPEPQGSLF
jgi:DNA repair photolyase